MTEDTIALLIDNMLNAISKTQYEDAYLILNEIKKELEKPDESANTVRIFHPQTIRDIYNLINSHSIRLRMKDYNFPIFLTLLTNVHKRRNEIQGSAYEDIDNQRKVVAEEMAYLRMIIPSKFKGVKVNRRFLDIAMSINPDIAKYEMERREKVKLWKAIETGDSVQIEKARKEFLQVKAKSDRSDT